MAIKAILAVVLTIIGFTLLFILMPMILEGVDIINGTTNVTQYYGLAELNRIAPTLILLVAMMFLMGGLGWMFRDRIKRKLFGG